MRRALFFLLALVGLSAPCSSAETNEVDVLAPLTLDDLDPETRSAVMGLAVSMSGERATQATIDDNVASILAILQTVRQQIANNAYGFRTYVFTPLAQNIADFLGVGLYESFSGSSRPSQLNAFIYEIQRALYGQSGVPSASDALLPTVWEIADFLPQLTNSANANLSFTNALYSSGTSGTYSIADLAAISAAFFNGMSFPEGAGAKFEDILTDITLIQTRGPSWFYDVLQGSHASSDAYQNLTRDFYNDGVPSQWATILEGVDSRVLAQLEPMIADAVSDGNYGLIQAIQDNGYGIEAALTNLAAFLDVSLRQALTNFWATSADEYRAARMDSTTDDIEDAGRDALEDAVTDATDEVDTATEEEPDFGITNIVHNPYTPIGTALNNLASDISSKMEISAETCDPVVVLFDGQSGSPLDAAGRIQVNVQEELSTAAGVLGNLFEWVWLLVNRVLTILFVLRTYKAIGEAI